MEVCKLLVFSGEIISLKQASLLTLKDLLEIGGPFAIYFSFLKEFGYTREVKLSDGGSYGKI